MKTTLTEKKYKIVKIFRISRRHQILFKDIKNLEEAQRIVKSYPDSTRSMVVYYSY